MTKTTNVRRTLTFRQVFITICILLVANIAMQWLTGSTPAVQPAPQTFLYSDSIREQFKDYQILMVDNGDLVIYDRDRVVGVIKYHPNCDLQKIIEADND